MRCATILLGLAAGCSGEGTFEPPGDGGSGFEFAYDYQPDFDSDLTGTAIAPSGPPDEAVGSWDAEPRRFARDLHVRPPGGTYGRGDGSDWSNALAGLPASLERGTRYLVASGEYYDGPWSARFFHVVFDAPESGESYVGVFKATAGDHGSDAGWEAAFGEGQARFGPVSVLTGFLAIDGRLGIGADEGAYGIAIRSRDCAGATDAPITFPWNSTARNVSFRHVDVRGCGHRPDPTHGSEDAIYSYANGVTRFALKDSFVHDSFRGLLFLQNSRDVFVEGTVFARAGLHHEAFTIALRNTDDVVIRRNVLSDSYGEFIGLQGTSNVRLYGNVIRRTLEDWSIWTAIFMTERGSDVLIYNNTFHDLEGLNVGVRASPENLVSNLQVANNLWTGSRAGQIMLSGNHTHNAFWDNQRTGGAFSLDERIEEATKQVLSSDPFVDGAAGDLRLSGPTAPGRSLGAPFDRDLAGVERGVDGAWDRGAYEYAE
jgi:hypothetical protein